jgi:hypothetical protein
MSKEGVDYRFGFPLRVRSPEAYLADGKPNIAITSIARQLFDFASSWTFTDVNRATVLQAGEALSKALKGRSKLLQSDQALRELSIIDSKAAELMEDNLKRMREDPKVAAVLEKRGSDARIAELQELLEKEHYLFVINKTMLILFGILSEETKESGILGEVTVLGQQLFDALLGQVGQLKADPNTQPELIASDYDTKVKIGEQVTANNKILMQRRG